MSTSKLMSLDHSELVPVCFETRGSSSEELRKGGAGGESPKGGKERFRLHQLKLYIYTVIQIPETRNTETNATTDR